MRNSVWILVPSICLLAPAIAAGQTGGRDLKITTRHSYSGSAYATTTYYSGENSRTETQIFSGNVKGHRRAQIRKKGAESIQVYDLDLDAHVYASYQTDLRGVVPGAKPIALKPSGKTYVINTDVVDTGERKEMFGHIARHLISKEKRIGGRRIAMVEIQKVKSTDGTSMMRCCRCHSARKRECPHTWLGIPLGQAASSALTRSKPIALDHEPDFR
ncbi:MAG: hypothetical protein ACXV5J_04135 [Candidatus Angelobacter sp.]